LGEPSKKERGKKGVMNLCCYSAKSERKSDRRDRGGRAGGRTKKDQEGV